VEEPKGTFPWYLVIVFVVLIAGLLVFILRGRIFPPGNAETRAHENTTSAASSAIVNITAKAAQKSPLILKFEAKEMLKNQVSRGKNVDDVKLEMIKQGWDSKIIDAAEKELK
jgi:hypothetical protein